MPKSIRVRILTREYPLLVDEGDEAMTREIAGLVDAGMRQFAAAHAEQSELTAAVMTALSLAEELVMLRQEREETEAALNQHLAHLERRLDQALSGRDRE